VNVPSAVAVTVTAGLADTLSNTVPVILPLGGSVAVWLGVRVVLKVWLAQTVPLAEWLDVVLSLTLGLCVKEIVGESLDIPLALEVMETEEDTDAVCVIVSDAEPNDADAEPLAVTTLAVADTLDVFVITVCVATWEGVWLAVVVLVTTDVLDSVGLTELVFVVVLLPEGLVELLGVFVSVDDDVMETEEEGLFDTVVEEVSVELVDGSVVAVIDVLDVSDWVPHVVELSEGDGVVEGVKDPLPDMVCVFVSVYDTVLTALVEPLSVAVPLAEYESVVLTVSVTPVGKVVILVVGVMAPDFVTEYVMVGLEDLDIVSVADTLWVFVWTAVLVCVTDCFILSVCLTVADRLVVAVWVLELVVEPVLDTVPVEVLELLAEPVMVGEAVLDLDGSAVLEGKDVRVAAPVLDGVLVLFAVVVMDGLRV
jgi:hypothetical protein